MNFIGSVQFEEAVEEANCLDLLELKLSRYRVDIDSHKKNAEALLLINYNIPRRYLTGKSNCNTALRHLYSFLDSVLHIPLPTSSLETGCYSLSVCTILEHIDTGQKRAFRSSFSSSFRSIACATEFRTIPLQNNLSHEIVHFILSDDIIKKSNEESANRSTKWKFVCVISCVCSINVPVNRFQLNRADLLNNQVKHSTFGRSF